MEIKEKQVYSSLKLLVFIDWLNFKYILKDISEYFNIKYQSDKNKSKLMEILRKLKK